MLNQLILGIGLFFLGMQIVGEYLRRLSGPSFHDTIRKYTKSPIIEALMGVGFGALMQSATAVTFTLISMVRSGLMNSTRALPIILGSNIGLTILAFVIVFDIHPLVAWWIGCAGIAVSLVRKPLHRAIAGVFLGIGLILFGLEAMGEGATFLKSAAWFQDFLTLSEKTPLLAFLIGFVAAALLQSNTGAALLIITITSAGGMSLETALLLIYGTNLGAMILRLYLSINLHGEYLRLVRFEDAFCAFSGVVMLVLFFLEQLGIPLVAAFVSSISSSIQTQLALGFLLSNLIPALLLYPLRNRLFELLTPLTPESPEEAASHPKYISDTALADPSTAIDLQAKELCRLFRMIHVKPRKIEIGEEDKPDPEFQSIGDAIERFGAQLASSNTLSEKDAQLLHLLRVELSITHHLEDAVREFCNNLAQPSDQPLPFEQTLSSRLKDLLTDAGNAMESLDIKQINALGDNTRRSNPELHALRHQVMDSNARTHHNQSETARTVELLDHFELSVWLLHRMVKILEDLKEQCDER